MQQEHIMTNVPPVRRQSVSSPIDTNENLGKLLALQQQHQQPTVDVAKSKRKKETESIVDNLEEQQLQARIKKLGKIPQYAGLSSMGAMIPGMYRSSQLSKLASLQKAGATTAQLAPVQDVLGMATGLTSGLVGLGGLSMGLSKTQQAQKLKSLSEKRDVLGTTGRVAELSGSLSMLRSAPFSLGTLAAMATGDPFGAVSKIGSTMTGAASGMMGMGTQMAGGLASTMGMKGVGAGLGGLSGLIASSPVLAGSLALSLPSLVSGLSSMAVARKRLKIRGKPETRETIIKKFGEPRSTDGLTGWMNRILLDPSFRTEDRQIALLQMMVEV